MNFQNLDFAKIAHLIQLKSFPNVCRKRRRKNLISYNVPKKNIKKQNREASNLRITSKYLI